MATSQTVSSGNPLPPLTDDVYAALRDDIAARGIVVPVVMDDRGQIIDGHHRMKIAGELGIANVPIEVRHGLAEEEGYELAVALNVHRRHLTVEQRRGLVAQLRQRGWSTPRIADAVGVDQSTVVRDLSTYADAYVEAPERIIGKDGKSRPAHRPPVTRVESEVEARAVTDLRDEGVPPPAGTHTLGDLVQAAREEIRQEALIAADPEQDAAAAALADVMTGPTVMTPLLDWQKARLALNVAKRHDPEAVVAPADRRYLALLESDLADDIKWLTDVRTMAARRLRGWEVVR